MTLFLNKDINSNHWQVVNHSKKTAIELLDPEQEAYLSPQQLTEQKESLKTFNKSKESATKPRMDNERKLDTALLSLTKSNFYAQIEQLKLTYPGSDLNCLKFVANYLNNALPFDCDPVFLGKTHKYPSILLMRSFLAKRDIVAVLKTMSVSNLEYYFHDLLLTMASDLSKNLPVFGYKLFLQIIAQNWPTVCENEMAKTAILLNSYENRPNICLSILWAIGQGGFKNLGTGIKVWLNLMLPQLEMRSYTKFVVDYLSEILKKGTRQKLIVNPKVPFMTYNVLRGAEKLHIDKEHQESLLKSCKLFLKIYIANGVRPGILFLHLLGQLNDETHQIEIDGCIQCLLKNITNCLHVWRLNFPRLIIQSMILIQKINENPGGKYDSIKGEAYEMFLQKTIYCTKETNRKYRPKYKKSVSRLFPKNGQEKGSNQQKKKQNQDACNKHGKCCKWMMGSFLLVVLIGAALAYDTNVNGKGVFAKSAFGKILKDAGMLPYVETAWYTTMGASARGYKWAEINVPPYANPALQLTSDLFKVLRNMVFNAFNTLNNFVQQKLPVAANFIEQYVPGLPEKIGNASEAVKNLFVNIFEKTVTFFQTQVLVGRFSPENLSIALNQTQNAAASYYNMFHQKVDAYAKLK